ncbi:HAD family hydrolase [Leptospira sp. 2 VSF19]|uniref:phosphoglycolate phosphatase n=1 Tax=Leptospira soteropolitanensis TaxID=2950025 RepID=A0AAW5VR84_9LEPT|nr:HAD-IA family hydrolase [Leptospira soteropolitanensis]MCW7493539.1 HAD family hydrolase [Leptospira soteropolitanensis]MCW7500929.1 HAD family hydrolase [Leptospira soteropolitanensis]MCW7523391.1 HAD family hydrolase [Leptospira soteropolitanensis]MCW7527252.1 HAD family hydrolase [Leptospira soteropolitanensis]MCW7531109.1 HAD family hydrolase [Leptospira soteropolitanensis]
MHLLQQKKNWIFDMDGTLTIAKHDFDAIKRELEIPFDTDILTSLSNLPKEEAKLKHIQLDSIELKIAKLSTPSPGCFDLLKELNNQTNRLGILTRNSFSNSIETLKAAGLIHFFQSDYIFCREHALPKPNPEGIFRLMELWQADPKETVMIGDYLFDLDAGKAAGVETIYIDPEGKFPFREFATHCIRDLGEILNL